MVGISYLLVRSIEKMNIEKKSIIEMGGNYYELCFYDRQCNVVVGVYVCEFIIINFTFQSTSQVARRSRKLQSN